MTLTTPPPATVTEHITTAGVPLRRRHKATPGRVLLYGGLTFGAIISLFPLYWLVVMASNSTSDIYTTPPTFIPGPRLFDNIGAVFSRTSTPSTYNLPPDAVTACAITTISPT